MTPPLPASHRPPHLTVREEFDFDWLDADGRRLAQTRSAGSARDVDSDRSYPDLTAETLLPEQIRIGRSARMVFSRRHHVPETVVDAEIRTFLADVCKEFTKRYARQADGFHRLSYQGRTVLITPDGKVVTRYWSHNDDLPSKVARRWSRGECLEPDRLREETDPTDVGVTAQAIHSFATVHDLEDLSPNVESELRVALERAWTAGNWEPARTVDGEIREDRYYVKCGRDRWVVGADSGAVLHYHQADKTPAWKRIVAATRRTPAARAS